MERIKRIKRLKSFAAAVLAAVVMTFPSCGSDEPQIKIMEYETPIAKFVSAYNKEDEKTLLNCFTPAAADEFSESGQSLYSSLKSSTERQTNGRSLIYYTLGGKEELSEDDIASLKEEYSSEYGKRLDIKKAYKLSVTFSVATGGYCSDMDIVTVKADSGWFIYGDVITSLDLQATFSESSE